MYIKIKDHNDGTTRIIENPLTLAQFVKVHFTWFGIYGVEKTGASCYEIYNGFDGDLVYTVSKPGKREIAKLEKEAV